MNTDKIAEKIAKEIVGLEIQGDKVIMTFHAHQFMTPKQGTFMTSAQQDEAVNLLDNAIFAVQQNIFKLIKQRLETYASEGALDKDELKLK